MSAGSETLERVADILPPEQRERLLRVALRFRDIPEEDEFLQVLEAIGLMTLVWKEIPQEIHSILEGAKPIQPNAEFLNSTIRSTIRESIPSFEDLRQISQSLNQQQVALKRHMLQPPSGSIPSVGERWRYFVSGVFVGLLIAVLLIFSGELPMP